MPTGAEERARRRAAEAEAEREAAMRAEHERTAAGGSASAGTGAEVDDFGDAFTGWISGRTEREAAAKAEQDRQNMQNAWAGLGANGPSVQDLTAEYLGESDRDEYGNLIGDPSAFSKAGGYRGDLSGAGDQTAAMRALRSLYEQGGYTDADRTASRAMRDQQAMQMGAANQASMQQMQARGMGGSGAELAMRMGAGEAMAGANAQSDASIQQAAMQRALQSLQGYGAMANAYRSSEADRMSALDAFNQSNTDWRRGREARNTTWSNQSEESRAHAEQTRHQNQERAVAGQAGVWEAGADDERQNLQMANEGIARGVNAASGAVTGLASAIPTRRAG